MMWARYDLLTDIFEVAPESKGKIIIGAQQHGTCIVLCL